jgi:predicted phosphodiesterase
MPGEAIQRIGLLSDIHEAVEPLRAAIAALRARAVDTFVVLGDVAEDGPRADATVALLAGLPGVAVWGNHDFGRCTSARAEEPANASVTDRYFSRMQPSAQLAGLRFQHVDLHFDPSNEAHLWSFSTPAERIGGLAECAERRVFTGHLHAWEIVTPHGVVAWRGERPFRYAAGQRYLTTVHAVLEGWCAMFDVDADTIEPIRVA